jgi:hypothetical protein
VHTRDWWALCRDLRAGGRLREALAAAARGAAQDGDAVALQSLLAAEVVALRPEVAMQRGDALLQSTPATVGSVASVASILDELVTGADGAAALRALAALVPGASAAALDFIAASLLLAPGRRMTHLTRALVRLQHGDEAGARQDTELVAGEAFEAAAALRTYLDTAFRPFDFWPVHAPLAADPSVADVPLGIERNLDEIRQTLAIYAARVARLRAAVRSLVGSAAAPVWLPPDTTPLCPGGFPPLERRWIASDPEGQGAEASADDTEGGESIEIDEEVTTRGVGAPALLAAAQAEWAALGWLCWAVGLDRVALPDAVRPRELLAVAMKLIVTRCWRVQDLLRTGGLLAQTNQVPGFLWQGFDLDALPPHLVRAAAEEYISVRSMFFWLTSAEIASPFQTDLRKV